jgi:hypothetical protein
MVAPAAAPTADEPGESRRQEEDRKKQHGGFLSEMGNNGHDEDERDHPASHHRVNFDGSPRRADDREYEAVRQPYGVKAPPSVDTP